MTADSALEAVRFSVERQALHRRLSTAHLKLAL